MTYIITHKWRSLAFFIAVATVTFGCFFLANASAKQRRSSPQRTFATRTAIHISGDTAAPASADGTAAASALGFSSPIQLTRPLSPAFFQQGGEPEIKIDIFGNIYVTAIQGVPGGVDLWKSTDNGATFVYIGQPDGAQDKCPTIPQCAGLGGGDDSIDVSSSGYLYVSSLWLGGTTMSTSTDGGMGGVAPGQAWTVNPASGGIPVNDRQWIAAYGPETVYMTFDQAPAPGPLWFVKSVDAGKTFSAPMMLTGVSSLSRENNLVVDQYNGNIYTTFTPAGSPNQINLLRSVDGGATWTTTPVYTGPGGTTVENSFPILAVDRGGNLHLVFAQSTGITARTNTHVFLMSSNNQGATWLPPVQVDSGANTQSSIMPWVVAGSPGVVDITWYGSSSNSPDAPPYDWHVFFAQTTNALAAVPTFTQVLATPAQIHNDGICARGSGCGGTTRHLLEYYAMTLDSEGFAHISFVDGLNNCPTANCISNAWYTKQISGQSAYAPPAAPGPATFSANIAIGAPGAEPSIWVDSFNCIYVTAPGNPWVWKSTNAGASFLSPTNPVADESTLTGGDEDIISLPKQDGSHTRPDQLYFTDLGLTTCHIRKSTAVVSTANQNPVWFKPGPGGAAGDVSVSSDRQWLAGDQGVPAAGDQVIYHWEHELASEAMRISSLVNDTAWQFTSGMTDPELIDLLTSTLPNTNPGPIFVNKTTHRVFALFNGSVPSTNAVDPPFGKLLNVWEMDAAPPLNAAAPVTDVQNHPVFKGTYDSPNNPPPAVGPPVGPNFGTNNANIFPAGDIDSAGNIYVAWSMNNSRTNEYSIWFASSHDNGKTYYGPFPVSSGPLTADETAVFPWVAAGDNGRVDIIWYGTNSVGDPNELPSGAAWKLYFAQTLNGNAREPVFTVVQPNPSNVIHTGQISTGGLIGSADRSLLDFMEIAIGPDGLANIIYADNAGQGTRAEYTRQNGGPLAKTNPSFVTCLPGPPVPIAVVSRKTHGPAGPFDVDLLPPAPGIECRSGGASNNFQIVVTFPLPVTVGASTMTTGTGSVVNTSVSGNVVTVNLTGVTNAQRITVSLNNVTDANGSGNVPVNMGVLAGDTTADTFVNSADISQTKSRSGQAVSVSNFRSDVTIDGFLNSADISLVKSKSGTALP